MCAVSTVNAANMDKYYKRTGAKFLAQKAAEEDVHKLPSGMLYKVRHHTRHSTLIPPIQRVSGSTRTTAPFNWIARERARSPVRIYRRL